MKNVKLLEILKAAGDHMRLDLEQRLTDHPGELGAGREEVVRRFLSKHLPKRFEVSHGFVFDATGAVSQQLDIIIADSLYCPHLERAGGGRLFPSEAVVAVGQVKSVLTSRRELEGALSNLRSAKKLDRSSHAYPHQRPDLEMDQGEHHFDQIFTFLLVMGKALDGDTVRDELGSAEMFRNEAHLWPNVVLALDQYLVTYCCQDGICPNPMHALGIALKPASEEPRLLMRFYLLLARAIEVTRTSSMPYDAYMAELGPWDANVIYPIVDSPQPYLRNVLY